MARAPNPIQSQIANSTPVALVYHQSTGNLTLNGVVIGRGYSGIGVGRNNPDLQATPNTGPIPQGTYQVGRQFHSSHTGPGAIRLTPNVGTQTFGRRDFEIHGDSTLHPGQASNGCIVIAPAVRRRLDQLPGRTLMVTR